MVLFSTLKTKADCILTPNDCILTPNELLPKNLARKSGIYESTSFFYMPQSWDMGQILSLLLRRKVC